MKIHRALAATLVCSLAVALTASAQVRGSMILERDADRVTMTASASELLPRHCGGVRPSRCEEVSRYLNIHGRADSGDIRSVMIRVSSPGPRPVTATIRQTPPEQAGLEHDDAACAHAQLYVETSSGRVAARSGNVTLRRWDGTHAEGTFQALFSDPRAPRTLRGTFTVTYRPAEDPPPCGGEPLP